MIYREALRFTNVGVEDFAFGGLVDATFAVYSGETVAIEGLMNSGRVTLMNLLSGAFFRYRGEVFVFGSRVDITGYESIRTGQIACFSITPRLFGNLSISDNIIVTENGKHLYSRIKKFPDRSDYGWLFTILKLDFKNRELEELSRFETLKIEILKAVMGGARILVFVMLNSYCSDEKLEEFKWIILALNERGYTVILDNDGLFYRQLEETVNRVIVLRGGVVSMEFYRNAAGHFDVDHIHHAGLGKPFDTGIKVIPKSAEGNHSIPHVKMVIEADRDEISFYRGTITGLYDGADTFPKTLQGFVDSFRYDYDFQIDGQIFRPAGISDLVDRGIAVITKEALDPPVFYNLSPVENVSVLAQRRFGRKLFYNRRVSGYLFDVVMNKYPFFKNCAALKARGDCYDLPFESLYELMIAKWLAINPDILIIHAPLSNNDTKNAERYRDLFISLSREGKTLILVSSRIEALVSICAEVKDLNSGVSLKI